MTTNVRTATISDVERMCEYRACKKVKQSELTENNDTNENKQKMMSVAKSGAQRILEYHARKKLKYSVSEDINDASDEFYIDSAVECPTMTEERTKGQQIRVPMTNAEIAHKYRLRKKFRANPPAAVNAAEEVKIRDINTSYIPPPPCLANGEFEKRFTSNHFGVSCSVCDRLWFERDLRGAPAWDFPGEDTSAFRVCDNS